MRQADAERPGGASRRLPPAGKGSRAALLLSLLGLLAVEGVLITSGLRGLDFGRHWDEYAHVERAVRASRTGVLLPHFYNYPSLSFWLTLAAGPPDLTPAELEAGPNPEVRRYRLRMRRIFLLVTAVTPLWVWLMVLVRRRRPLEAFLAAAFLGFSWQVAYHLRWVAPDGLLMQLGALALLLAVAALQARRKDLLVLGSAAAAGLACGAKYPGGVMLLAPLAAAALASPGQIPRKARLGLMLRSGGVFALAYLFTTPGTLLEPELFLTHVRFEIEHYAGGHGPHTIEAGLPHLAAMGRFLGLHLLAPWEPLAILLAAAACCGLGLMLLRDRRAALVLVGPPAIYAAFMGTQNVMIARNLLVLAPPLAVCAARGVVLPLELMRSRALRIIAACLLVATAGLQGGWLVHAGETVRHRHERTWLADARSYLDAHPGTVLSPELHRALERAEPGVAQGHGLAAAGRQGTVLFLASEAFGPDGRTRLPANRPPLVEAWFGPLDVDVRYYPDWWANDRIVAVSLEAARRFGLPFLD